MRGPEDEEPVTVRVVDEGVLLQCKLGSRCFNYRRSKRTLCQHTLAAANRAGHHFFARYRDSYLNYIETHDAAYQSALVPTGAGSKKARYEEPRTRDIAPPTTALPFSAEDRQRMGNMDYLRHNQIWQPSVEELCGFAQPSASTPSQLKGYQNQEPFEFQLAFNLDFT